MHTTRSKTITMNRKSFSLDGPAPITGLTVQAPIASSNRCYRKLPALESSRLPTIPRPFPRLSPVYNAGQQLPFTGVPWSASVQANQRAAVRRASSPTFISGYPPRFFSADSCCCDSFTDCSHGDSCQPNRRLFPPHNSKTRLGTAACNFSAFSAASPPEHGWELRKRLRSSFPSASPRL